MADTQPQPPISPTARTSLVIVAVVVTGAALSG